MIALDTLKGAISMNTKEILTRFEALAAQYMRELDAWEMEELTRKPREEAWSLGQLYVHLIQSALFLHLPNAVACSQKAPGTKLGGQKTERGAAVYTLGSFPPIKIHVPPSEQYTPKQPVSKEQLHEGIQQVLAKMNEVEPAMREASSDHTLTHPGLGDLHAVEWFRLVEMHYRHHLRQLDTLKEQVAAT
ncbi:DinB family protein [Brevibacillus migulae]|uniref:DinB family protein n=1 Tax=Brevibacillus migulae TaxID=1644114 RepID=UPI001F177487|nr:DinB family protein [Brevibacillus migulae]